ncbi:MAG: Stp1/IreP family PP2C-type Ser/Thr phosphatase [Armatimonadota bacterium]
MGKINISTAWKSDIGRRSANEDSCLVLTSGELGGGYDGLYIIADGMGGRASGATASSTAVNAVKESLLQEIARDSADPELMLSRSLKTANSAVYNAAQTSPELQGMGTTCVAVLIKNGRLHYGHLGDSRAYMLRDAKLIQLTDDHSFVAEKVKSGEMTEEQARKSRFRNIITRAVGLEPSVEPEVGSMDLKPGDVLLLCTDGLSSPVKEEKIVDILLSTKASDVDGACSNLINAALQDGGTDNITVVLAAYGTAISPRQIHELPNVKNKPSRKKSWVLPVLISLLIGVGIGVYPGQMLIDKYLKHPIAVNTNHTDAQSIDISLLKYDDPVSILYMPVQGGMLTLDSEGYLHVIDRLGQLMRLDTSGGVVYTSPAREGLKPAAATPRMPMAASDVQGNLYISDPVGKQIIRLDKEGNPLESVAQGKLTMPQALAVDTDGTIYVIDAGRLKVLKPKTQTADQSVPVE